MRYIRWFEDIRAADIPLVGGKGANLGEMARAGFPIPPGFCITAGAYQDFLASAGLSSAIASIQTHRDDRHSAKRLRERIRQTDVPCQIAEEVEQAYAQLARLLEGSDLPVAVRSSATAEDLPEASFAGQQDTYLNIRGPEAVLEHVRSCWASLWNDEAVSYREKQRFPHQSVYLCVVVQSMIEADVAGVLFTANPITGNLDEAVINASWGLGESIVSGVVSPDTLTLRKADGEILERKLGGKELIIEYAAGGGISERSTTPQQRERPALTDDQAQKLLQLGNRIEAHYGTPQDIEWAFKHDTHYALQARPITTLPDPSEYNRTMFIEFFPRPLSPLFLSVIDPLFSSMLDFTFSTLGFRPPKDGQAVRVFYNQPYFNVSYIRETLEPLSEGTRKTMIAALTNPFGHQEAGERGERSLAYLRMALAIFNFLVRFPRRLPGLLARYHSEVNEVAQVNLDDRTDEQIVDHIRRLVFDSASTLLNYDYLMIAVIGQAYRILGSLLDRGGFEHTEEIKAKLVSGVSGNATMKTNTMLWDLAQLARELPQVNRIFRSESEVNIESALREAEGGAPFLAALDDFLEEFGHRELHLDILYPTWGEDPAPVFTFIKGYLDADEAQSPHRQLARLESERQALTGEIFAGLRGSLMGRWILLPLMRWMLHKAQLHTRERDTMHFELTRLFPPFRRLLRELGSRWHRGGHLSDPEDIYFLHFAELEGMARQPQSMLERVTQRRHAFEEHHGRPFPDIIRGTLEQFLRPELELQADGALRGIAGSPGVATGRARVIHTPEEFSQLQKGEVLVAPFTNPIWTPLFAIASAVITEVGGILSHGAIVAREYGIPAVMSVPGATEIIQPGQELVVDGNQGLVTVAS